MFSSNPTARIQKVVESLTCSKDAKQFFRQLADVYIYADAHYTDNSSRTLQFADTSLEHFIWLLETPIAQVHIYMQELKSDYMLSNLLIDIYKNTRFQMGVIAMSSVEDLINQRLYTETNTVGWEDTLGLDTATYLSIDQKKEARYNEEFSKILGKKGNNQKRCQQFHECCLEKNSLLAGLQEYELQHIYTGKIGFLNFLQIYHRWIIYNYGQESSEDMVFQIVELACYTAMHDFIRPDAMNEADLMENYLNIYESLTVFCREGEFGKELGWMCEFFLFDGLKICYNGDEFVFHDHFSSTVNAAKKINNGLNIKKKIKEFSQLTYNCFVEDIEDFFEDDFYKGYTPSFTFREYKHFMGMVDGIDSKTIDKAKYHHVCLRHFSGFYRYEELGFHIKLHTLLHALAGKAQIAVDKKKLFTLDIESKQEYIDFFKAWNEFALYNFSGEELTDLLHEIKDYQGYVEKFFPENMDVLSIFKKK